MLRLVSALLFAVGLSLTTASAQTLPLPSAWKNARGSEMRIWPGPTPGSFRGEYINSATGFDCRGVPFDLVGQTRGSTVKFVVVWKNFIQSCNSVTAWVGRLTTTDTLTTGWELAYVDGNTGLIKILRGTDVFQRVP